LTSLTSATLEYVGGIFALLDLPALAEVRFEKLIYVEVLVWAGLPVLEGFAFAEGCVANSIYVRDTVVMRTAGLSTGKTVERRIGLYEDTALKEVELGITAAGSIGAKVNNEDLVLRFPLLRKADVGV
jgi:hypothetical protein